MKTGYFARAHEDGHSAKSTQVHIVDYKNKPICRYKPHKTMQFLCCAAGIVINYVKCKECKEKGVKILRPIRMGSYIKMDKYAKGRGI